MDATSLDLLEMFTRLCADLIGGSSILLPVVIFLTLLWDTHRGPMRSGAIIRNYTKIAMGVWLPIKYFTWWYCIGSNLNVSHIALPIYSGLCVVVYWVWIYSVCWVMRMQRQYYREYLRGIGVIE